jgi:uncharacterized RDD family membrane protein YckC
MTTYDYDKPKNDYDKPKRFVGDQPLAGIGSRVVAIIIDNLLIGMVAGILGGIARHGGGAGAVFLLATVAYQWYFLTRNNGQTIGKMIMHIRVVKVNGAPLMTADAVLRVLGYWINGFFFGLGWFWALFDRDRQGWHDKIAGTYVVQA